MHCVKDDKQQLNELHLNLLGKLFITAVGTWLVGKTTNLKLRGTKKEIAALTTTLQSSKKFQDELKRSGASVQSVMDKLKVKNMNVSEFERTFGIKWPL